MLVLKTIKLDTGTQMSLASCTPAIVFELQRDTLNKMRSLMFVMQLSVVRA